MAGILILLLSLAGFPALLHAADDRVPVPPLTGRVVDQTGTLSESTLRDLNDRLAAFEARKGSQVAVLIVPTTRPEAIEQYSIRVAEQWKLGRKKVDDGAILLVAKDDRALRIEVGYGLEGALTDLLSRRIIDDIITPHFRTGDFDGGITAGVDAILKVIDGEPLPAPQARSTRPHAGLSPGLLFAALFVAWSFARGLASLFGPMRAGLVSGGLVGALGFFILKSIAFASGLGFLAFILTAIFGSGGGLGAAGGRRRGPWGGFGGGGWGGGSGSGWGSGGGGFSGGGGGFGGGGASGRW